VATEIARPREWAVLAAAIILALALRLVHLGSGLDPDEVWSVLVARFDWPDLLSTVIRDKSHPPFHYALLKLSIDIFGESEISARLTSLLLGVGLIPVAFAICRELRLKTIDSALVLTLVATSGVLIELAQYARDFVALEFFAALSLLLYIRLRDRPSWWGCIFFTITNILMVYSHYWGFLLIAAEALLALTERRKAAALTLLSAGITGLAFLPWAALVVLSAYRQENLAGQISWMGTGVPGPLSYLRLFAGFNGVIDFDYSARLGLMVLGAPIALVSLRSVAKDGLGTFFHRGSVGFWIAVIVVPLLLTSLGSYLAKQNLWGVRHLSMTAVPYYLLIGLSLSNLPNRAWTHGLRGLIALWVAGSLTTYLAEPYKKLHWETLAQTIAAREPAPIYFGDVFCELPLAYYLERIPGFPTSNHVKDLAGVFVLTALRVGEPMLPEEITADRFWYVYRDVTWHAAQPDMLFARLGYGVHTAVSTRANHRALRDGVPEEVTALLIERK
jgi:4-amino-4-deoxy-L-arabinose transferase-like glycosyltransferase